MSSSVKHQQTEDFDSNEIFEEEIDSSAMQRLQAMASAAAWHLRRTVVFVPMFGIVFLAIGFFWFQSVREESGLNSRSDQLAILLSQPAPEPEALVLQAKGWDSAYGVVMDGRIARPDDSDLIERVINAATDSGLVIVEAGTIADSEVTIENEVYTETPVLISAIGTIEGIEIYLALLETSEFEAFGIEASLVEEGLVGYRLTMRGQFFSLPANFGEADPDESTNIAATQIVPVELGDAQ